METKTSKITLVTGTGSFNSAYGLLYKWEISFENGDFGEANTKTNPQTTWVVGKMANYTLEPNVNPAFNGKLKLIKEPHLPPANPGTGVKNEAVQKMIVAQSSISSAVEMLKGGSQYDADNVIKVADKFFNYVMLKVQ